MEMKIYNFHEVIRECVNVSPQNSYIEILMPSMIALGSRPWRGD